MKKDILIIGGILSACIIVGVIFVIVVQKSPMSVKNVSPTPIISNNAYGSLSITPTPDLSFASLSFIRKNSSTVDIIIDTNGKNIDGVQLVIKYDPFVLQNMQILPGPFLQNVITLKNTIDNTAGKIFYAAAVTHGQKPLAGKGVIATLSFAENLGVKSDTTLQFLPQTKATEENIEQSIIKHTVDLTIPLNQ